MAHNAEMKELNVLASRLRKVTNLSEFARKYKLQYRTLTRMRQKPLSVHSPTLKTAIAVGVALDKEGL